MRARNLAVIALALLAILGVAPDASAQRLSKGWLERLSGPGPFDGFEFWSPTILCFDGDSVRWLYEKGEEEAICVDAGVGWFESEFRPEFRGRTDANIFEVGVYYDLHPALAVGGGIGFVRFSGAGFEDLTRLTLTPVRVTLRPLAIGRSRSGPISPWRTLVQVDFREYVLPARITGADFGAPQVPLDEKWEPIGYVSVGVDVYDFLRRGR